MRFKNLMGLVAIGGAVAYANKQRGGDWTFASFKDTLTDLGEGFKQKLASLTGAQAQTASQDVDADDGFDKSSYDSGFGGSDTARSMRH